MAEEINLEVNITAGNGKKTVAEVRKELEDTQKVAKSTGDSLSQGLGTAEKAAGSLKSQLKAMMMELGTLDESSPRFKQLTKDAGELKDKIGDISQKVTALSSDTKKLDALVGVGSAIAGGFQAAQGAMALFGTDSKKVEKAIQNIIAVQGILNGVQQVGTFITTKGIVQDGIAATARLILTGTTVKQTAAQIALNGAMIANPIGLIIVGIAALVAGVYLLIKNFKAIVNWITDLENLKIVFLALLGPIGWLIIAYQKLFGEEAKLADAREKEAARQKKAREDEAAAHKERIAEIEKELKAKQDAADKQIGALQLEKETLEANGKSSAAVTVQILEAELEKTKAVLDANQKKLQSAIEYYTNLAVLSGKSTEEFKASMKAQGIDLDLAYQKSQEQLQRNQDDIQRSENAITKFKREQNEERSADAQAAADEAEAIRKAAYEAELERLKNLQQQRNEFLIELENAENAYYDSKLTAQQKEIQDTEDKYFELIEKATQYGLDSSVIEEARQAELLTIDEKYKALALEADTKLKADLKAKADKERADYYAGLQAKADVAKNYADSAVNLAKTVFALTNRFGKQDEESQLKRAKRQFQAQKLMNLGLAAIDGYKAITASLAQSPVAFGPVPNPAGIASLAFAITTTAANIAQIASSTFGGGASAPSAGGSGDVGSAISDLGSTQPNVNPINAGSTFLNQEPQKVVVLESDITGVQKKVLTIQGLASFG